MLMLTHTWMLRMFLGADRAREVEPDFFVHNVAPDILTVHKDINAEMTHNIARFRPLPEEHGKAIFVQFHLLVDDIAHHGKICREATASFDPASRGYAYLKGRPLVKPIMDFHNSLGQEITGGEAAYCSHILIEIAVDQLLQDKLQGEVAEQFVTALGYTLDARMEDFCRTSAWLYGIEPEIIAESLKKGKDKYDAGSDDNFASRSGRMDLYIAKFGLDKREPSTWSGLNSLLDQAMEMVRDYEEFLLAAEKMIRQSDFRICL